MQSYRVKDTASEDSTITFCRTRKEAHDKAKSYGDLLRPDIRIELVDIPTDGASLHKYLNGNVFDNFPVMKTWKLNPRGALVELNADGSEAKS